MTGALVSGMALHGCAGRATGSVAPVAADAAPARDPDPVREPGPKATRPPARLALVAGDVRETDFRIGVDLAGLVATPAGIDLAVLPSRGAADSLYRLRDDRTVALAIVQYDVFRTFGDEAVRGNRTARSIVDAVRIVAPLQTQEIHFVVRRDGDLRFVDQIRGRRINVGAVGSGSALTVAALHRQMFGVPIPPANVSYLDDRTALAALTIDRTVDVVVLIGGQPAPLLADMRPEARAFIRLLAVDPRQASSQAAYRQYFPARIRATSYPQWLDADVPALSVMSFLVASADRGADVDATLDRFTDALCRGVDDLRRQGHPKWREVDVTQKLGFGWTYRPASLRALDHCPRVDGAVRASR